LIKNNNIHKKISYLYREINSKKAISEINIDCD
jgi:hypothetical protein